MFSICPYMPGKVILLRSSSVNFLVFALPDAVSAAFSITQL